MPRKPKLYLETSVISYLGARPVRDVIVLAHQQITREWWDAHLVRYVPHVSEVVILEAEQGDAAAAKERLDRIASIPILRLSREAERLADTYIRRMPLPKKALRDALHMAVASLSGMEYLVTWNCRHIARGEIKRRLLDINTADGIESPVICTPEELMGA